MSRVKRGTTAMKRRRNILRQVKGYRFGRSTKQRVAREAIFHAGVHAFRHRRAKKRDARQLWTLRLNAAARENGLSYSKLIDVLKKKGVALDRKVLSTLAKDHPGVFARVVKKLS
ncbi:50S ribosomal protein L20 [Candidatus Kaiserbacteria bacterium RIFCSPHIGHO2_01_FULL_50_13]|uniref:Large ribosomal subunit protein bL20 n=1 Tax=Candidatus Kaiserbacteria bacterium RIFCSPLOWO2_01_FULL_50_24 TaxID=1798507 RepID=A0A1F6EII6_9BACT|nr:MAG: 50S ribosomal protein L20 [Candidatus Kaiserbacteria bacterium RIFCSPHIGHO2_01_FULL_50_13]OGG73439.1 MAG: 50S ribosomal protein L20 [Candidatus Kaiserbacteria bacterium RIFCSPLOWO2_01_FULL_50_24]OGG81322.1 MAG: 50S ribosomal protein L20 [Candidatus Kaiserbacteria bacterium RIFCSPLOWO2_02_FULL_51_13]